MSVLVAALVVGCGVLAGRLLVQRPRAVRGRHDPSPVTPTAVAKPEPTATVLEGFPCQLGDVVMHTAGGDEAWLAGAIVLSEKTPVAALFFSPEAGAMRAVLARSGSEELFWLTEAEGAAVMAGEPATTLEIAGERFDRRRRLPLRAERRGTGAPDVGSDVLYAEYTGLADSVLVVLSSRTRALVLRGEPLGPGTYDVLPRPSPC